ncbi:hypothetical protein COU79_01270 [Candidatus Peregrinibacteria bacterium CG10_big_fil_rev_8_21_14_0_10_54_7]|nr:MAG: hypothetical protein COU79_01270 [Candidatus Peregrinibacteria bacterium CG10_big_fil_rev_8_21_14_0_10_54_7]
MMNELHLTPAEQKLFLSLPEKLREGWKVREETQKFEDTKKHLRTRVSFLKIRDPKLHVLKEQIEKAKGQKEIAKIVGEFDLKGVHQADLAELFFALGPKPLFQIIETMLRQAKTDEEIESIAALSLIRNALLRSFIRNYV